MADPGLTLFIGCNFFLKSQEEKFQSHNILLMENIFKHLLLKY